MKQLLHSITFCFTICFFGFCNAQTDQNRHFQDVSVLLITRQFDRAKKQIDTDLIQSKEEADRILGYASLVYYYASLETGNHLKEQINALEQLQKLANASNNPRYKAYAAYGEMMYYLKMQKEVFIELFI